MAKYELHLDFTQMRESLADIEQCGPLRKLTFGTMHHCIGVANMIRMATGASCIYGPRSMFANSTHDMSTDRVYIKILRRG